ncbi:uncharacterized protein Tco025E_07161 [Trypanosoma conorhini]|uniref:Uncharacterized protein n=1 Tax=Trypanosoma conorhini TaxID=83891 RepID=A0A3R7MNT2_9TRYP|nr:uncharacterized protein Tco025E_07161 [Trypanosoma conorhini]RNF08891.1 hypothetical protein Tco025E_07161 [Trypanosoma conorhini]
MVPGHHQTLASIATICVKSNQMRRAALNRIQRFFRPVPHFRVSFRYRRQNTALANHGRICACREPSPSPLGLRNKQAETLPGPLRHSSALHSLPAPELHSLGISASTTSPHVRC